ncbi:MAG: helix-turn-helix transcriptional regulator [Ruminococcus sp.]|nr:helix-turn-helix transcriptional regulator [Ruminococcus sp.]
MSIGKAIKSERQKHNMTQAELSDAIAVNRVTLARYENGTKKPSLDTLIALADVLDCSLDGLLGRYQYIRKD